MAPSGGYSEHHILTTDLMGSAGYNYPDYDMGCGDPDDDDYMCKFGGTSAAQPMAAGIAALVLSVKPDLTHDQLHNIIRNSADNKLYDTLTTFPDQKYGYGMVNPMRALLSVSRGDADNNKFIDLLDALHLIAYIYDDEEPPIPHPLMGDADGDGVVNLNDILYIFSYLYDDPPGPEPPISFEYGDYEF